MRNVGVFTMKKRRRADTGYLKQGGYIEYSFGGRGNRTRKYAHIIVAENALGKPLPKGVQVHHVDGNPSNNDARNLIICPTDAYHKMIHQRTRAFDACGHADWRKCHFCEQYDDPSKLYLHPNGTTAFHRDCRIERRRGQST